MRYLVFILLCWPSFVLHADPGQSHYVGTLQAKVKEEPSSEAKTKFVIAVGRKLVEFEEKGEWVWVGVNKSGGKDGWVHKSQLSSTDPDGIKY